MRGLIPDAILTRPKMGFPVPFGRWRPGRWNGVAREVLLDRRTRERGIVDSAAVVERLLDEHRAGRRDAGDAIWALLNLELWYRTFIDGDGIQTLPAPADPRRGVNRRTCPAARLTDDSANRDDRRARRSQPMVVN